MIRKYNLNRKTTIKRPEDGQDFEFCYEDVKEPKLIGEGAFGVVFRIHHDISNMNLAVKRVDGKKLVNLNFQDLTFDHLIFKSGLKLRFAY